MTPAAGEVERIKQLLNKHWKLRCELVGPQSVDDLVRGVAEGHPEAELFKRQEGGADFDLYQALQTLAEAVILLKTCLETYKLLLSKKKGEKPLLAELEKEVRASNAFARVGKAAAKLEELLPEIAA